MTAAAKLVPTALDHVLRDVRETTRQLDEAVDDAVAEASDIQLKLHNLLGLIVRLHDDEHDEPIRWCSREACRYAEELRKEQNT